MNREDVAMDLTVQDVEILRGRLEQAEALFREYDQHGHSEGWWHRVNAFLASQQGEQATSEEIARVHPEQAEGYFHHPSGGFVYNAEGLVNIVTPYYPIKRLVFPRDMVADFTNAPDEVIVRERPNKEPVIDIRYCTFKGKNEDGSLPLDYSGKVKMHGWTCYGPLQDEQAEGAQGELEAFEAELHVLARRRNEHGDYVLPSIQDRWAGWQARAALAQPSVTISQCVVNGRQGADQSMAQPSPAPELERPVAVAYRSSESGSIYEQDYGLKNTEPLMEVAQHDRIVGALRSENEELRSDLGAEQSKCNSMEALAEKRAQERDAAQSRVAELEAEAIREERAHCLTVDQRDDAEGMANSLARAISKHLSVDIGEHSSMNSPWENALNAIEAAQAGQVPELDQLYSMLGVEDQVGAAKKIAELVGCQLSRTALTDAQMRRLYENSTEAENERLGFAAFARLIRRAEAVHQIAAAPAQGGRDE